MTITYGYTVNWRSGSEWVSVSVEGCDSADEAFRRSFDAARRLGYRRPRWWQLVRWASEINYEREAERRSSAANTRAA